MEDEDIVHSPPDKALLYEVEVPCRPCSICQSDYTMRRRLATSDDVRSVNGSLSKIPLLVREQTSVPATICYLP